MQGEGLNIGGRLGEERELELALLLLLEQGIQGEGFAEPGEEIARAEGVEAIIRTTKSVVRDRDQLQ